MQFYILNLYLIVQLFFTPPEVSHKQNDKKQKCMWKSGKHIHNFIFLLYVPNKLNSMMILYSIIYQHSYTGISLIYGFL